MFPNIYLTDIVELYSCNISVYDHSSPPSVQKKCDYDNVCFDKVPMANIP